MTKPRRNQSQSSPVQARKARALVLVLEGRSVTDIAAEIGVTRQTVHAWRRDPAFDEEVRLRQDEVTDAVHCLLMSKQHEVAEQLVALATSEETGDTARVNAARAFFELLGRHKGAPVVPPERGAEPENEEDLLRVLEGVPEGLLQRAIEARQPKEREL